MATYLKTYLGKITNSDRFCSRGFSLIWSGQPSTAPSGWHWECSFTQSYSPAEKALNATDILDVLFLLLLLLFLPAKLCFHLQVEPSSCYCLLLANILVKVDDVWGRFKVAIMGRKTNKLIVSTFSSVFPSLKAVMPFHTWFIYSAVKEISRKSATSCVKVKIKLGASCCNCKHWPPPLLQLTSVCEPWSVSLQTEHIARERWRISDNSKELC